MGLSMRMCLPAPARFESRRAVRWAFLFAVWVCVGAGGQTQTLARPGWAGSGLNADPWWAHTVFYRIPEGWTGGAGAMPEGVEASAGVATGGGTDFKGIARRLEYFQALGVDALLVPMPELAGKAGSASAAGSTEAGGVEVPEGFDELIRQASFRGIRVLLEVEKGSAAEDLTATARFWLSHGVAGFHVATGPGAAGVQQAQAMVQALRKVTSAAVGQRIVLSDYDLEAAGGSGDVAPAVSKRAGRRAHPSPGGRARRNRRAGPCRRPDRRIFPAPRGPGFDRRQGRERRKKVRLPPYPRAIGSCLV